MKPRLEVLRIALLLAMLCAVLPAQAQPEHSVARAWNEALLEAIRNDFARPTVHARNLFHVSAAMYDAWAAFDDEAVPYLLGQTRGEATCTLDAVPPPADVQAAREEVISYAAYRLLVHRFQNAPRWLDIQPHLDALFAARGYDPVRIATDYTGGDWAALGNHLAACYVAYGMQDGANEPGGYNLVDYAPVNPPLTPTEPGNPDLVDPNRWQPLRFEVFEDQSGNIIPGGIPDFVGPEWGRVQPFALREEDRTVFIRDGAAYPLYADPGPPPFLDTLGWEGTTPHYLWGFGLVAEWGSHLDPADGVAWDISPAATGGLTDDDLPHAFADYPAYYESPLGDGRSVNPRTGEPYAPNPALRGDVTRVLAEFWADGPDSETPPGHWFTLLNTVSDDPQLVKRFEGEGPVLSDLEWDVKAYFALGGAMHDVAVAAWGLKGRYDYIRPISALRAMAERGQSSLPDGPNYHPGGVPLVDGVIELIAEGDTLAGEEGEHVGEVKVRAWRGPDLIEDPETDVAGVGWIRMANWWPYQRPTFITPPFAGYVSGHSTFSRAAAEVLTRLTGDPFFPGGMGEFVAPAGEFLVFEDGPSETVRLQWATYRDAADQSALSRIWGGIHPPFDDLPGRRLGARLGHDAFDHATTFFSGQAVDAEPPAVADALALRAYPNPVATGGAVTLEAGPSAVGAEAAIYDVQGRRVRTAVLDATGRARLDTGSLAAGTYVVRVATGSAVRSAFFHVLSGARR